ncbi:hypothetical protein KC950_02620 [Candidatus Saccharibacteria bacterium]|nr:hypothetical protein [Candidatus Saccharibacteria bacterium]
MAKKQTKKTRKSSKSSLLSKLKSKVNKKPKVFVGILTLVSFASVGAFILVQSQAAPDNCQIQDSVPICDVDQTAGNYDSLLSRGSEPQELAKRGWGVYYGAAFRAPAHEYNGAVPITRIYNAEATYHDFVTPVQKSSKEAKYSGKTKNEGVAFYAWRTQVKDTVPVYRLTRAGPHTQTIFSTDKAWVDGLLAKDKNNDNGWKKDHLAPFLAFYAYPPNYKVADKPNPYDCSIQENFLSDRCTMQRENLQKEIDKQEAAKAQQEQIRKREEAAKAATSGSSSGTSSGSTSNVNDKIGNDPCPNNTTNPDAALAEYIKGVNEQGKKYDKNCHGWWLTYAKNKNTSTNNSNTLQGGRGGGEGGKPATSRPASPPPEFGDCLVPYKNDLDKSIKHYLLYRDSEKYKKISDGCKLFWQIEIDRYAEKLKRFLDGVAKIRADEAAATKAATEQVAAEKANREALVSLAYTKIDVGICKIKDPQGLVYRVTSLMTRDHCNLYAQKRSVAVFHTILGESRFRPVYIPTEKIFFKDYRFKNGVGNEVYDKPEGRWVWRR